MLDEPSLAIRDQQPPKRVRGRRGAAATTVLVLVAGFSLAAAPAATAADCAAPAAPGVDWSQCDLSGSDLSGADLAGANLSGSDLWFADLTDANLVGADVSGADLSDAFVDCDADDELGNGITGTPAILPPGWMLHDGTLKAAVTACPPSGPEWMQAYGRGGQDAECRGGWATSWAQWPNGGSGGFVCQRTIPSYGTALTTGDASAPPLRVRTRVTSLATAGSPFTAVQTPDGTLLVSVSDLPVPAGSGQQPAGIQVFRPAGRTYVSACVIRLPSTLPPTAGSASVMGLSLFDDGRFVTAAIEDNGLAVYRVADVTACEPSDPTIVPQVLNAAEPPAGTLDATVNAESTFAFVANEYGSAPGSQNAGNVGVTAIDLARVGATRLLRQLGMPGSTLAGVTLSPDGSRLYVTTEVTPAGTVVPGSDDPILGGPARCWSPSVDVTLFGTLSVIDVKAAESGVGDPILQTVAAGCSPTRMVVSADGSTLFTGARGDNRLLAFGTAALEGPDPARALLGHATTGSPGSDGSEPVGLQLFYDDRLLLIADSNRFAPTPQGNAEIFDVTDPSAPVLVQTVAAGLFPRNVTLAADGSTLFLTNYASNTVDVIRTLVG